MWFLKLVFNIKIFTCGIEIILLNESEKIEPLFQKYSTSIQIAVTVAAAIIF